MQTPAGGARVEDPLGKGLFFPKLAEAVPVENEVPCRSGALLFLKGKISTVYFFKPKNRTNDGIVRFLFCSRYICPSLFYNRARSIRFTPLPIVRPAYFSICCLLSMKRHPSPGAFQLLFFQLCAADQF